jgi:hypothetical protein
MKAIEIQTGLWLGDEKSVNNRNFIETNNIEIIIDCNKYLNYSSHKYNSPVREKLELNEIKHTIKFLLKITEYLYDNLRKFNNTLVYGHNDFNIAISIIIAFIMKYGKLNKNTVVQLLKSKLERISISRISNMSLEYFERHLQQNKII